MLPASATPPLQTGGTHEPHEGREPTLRAAHEARAGAVPVVALGVVGVASVALEPGGGAAVWTSGVLAGLAALLAGTRALSRSAGGGFARKLPAMAGANALVGVALFASPFLLAYRGRYAVFPIVLGFLVAAFAGAAFLLSVDQQTGGARASRGHSRRRRLRRKARA